MNEAAMRALLQSKDNRHSDIYADAFGAKFIVSTCREQARRVRQREAKLAKRASKTVHRP